MDCTFVGCGAAAGLYGDGLEGSSLSLAAACDRDRDRAAAVAEPHGATAYADVGAMLAAEDAPVVVNLTGHGAHADVTRQCLRAGRHVWSEKPLALDPGVAAELVAAAEERGLALGCAPVTPRCERQRQVRAALADGRLGAVRLAYAHAHVGRVTEWHDDPESFLRVGPLVDGAVYPLSLLVAWFGPVERVRTAHATDPWPDRDPATPEAPTHVDATVEFRTGPLVRLTASFYAPHRTREFVSLELHGDDGSLYLEDAGDLGGTEPSPVTFARTGREYTRMPLQQPPRAVGHLAGPERLADSVRAGSPDRRSARRGAHVVGICAAITRAAETGEPASVAGDGPDPVPGRDDRGPDRSGGRPAVDPCHGRGNAALRLPPVGVGCSRYRDGEYVDRRDSIETALDAGYRLLDSAELYGNEHRIGEILAAPGSPDRESLFLCGKVWRTNHAHVAEACRSSLAELGVDRFDCYMVHWPEAWAYTGPLRRLADRPVDEQEARTFPEDDDGAPRTADIDLEATWKRMEAVHDRGLARTIGLCNVDVETLHELLATATVPPAVVQVERHPYAPRHALVEACHDRGIRVVAHSPLSAPGLLEEPALAAVAAETGHSPAATVLAWNVQRGVVPIPSSTDRDHVVENLAAGGLRLSADQLARVDALEDPGFER